MSTVVQYLDYVWQGMMRQACLEAPIQPAVSRLARL